MAHAPSHSHPPTPGALTEEAFYADRQKMWAGFCTATNITVVATVITLALMAIFLV